MKKKSVTFCFIKLNANRFLQNHREKGDVSVKKLGLFFQSEYLLTLFPAEAVAMN